MGLFSFTKEIAMDLGTANTIILNNGNIVVDEPSVVALDRRTDKMIAVGERAICLQLCLPVRIVPCFDCAARNELI